PDRTGDGGPASEMNREGRANARGEAVHGKPAQFRPQSPFPPFPILPSYEEEMASSIIRQLADERGLVHVMEVFAPDCLKVLDDDGQRLTGHDLSP
ncbi:MAG: hypothetical protein OXC66_04245, partial [Roseovarius sp.]|nr:hypothetical protein [Roseovarius sp.]